MESKRRKQAEPLLLNIPDEVTEVILFMLDTPQLIPLRLINKGFNDLICSSPLWNDRMDEVAPYLEEDELSTSTSCIAQYRIGYMRMKQAGMFSTGTPVVDPQNRFLFRHEMDYFTTALVEYPRMRRDPNSKRSFVFGIRFKLVEFQGDGGQFGLISLENFTTMSQIKGLFALYECTRPVCLTSLGSFLQGGFQQVGLFPPGQGINEGDMVELELDIAKQQLTMRVCSSNPPPIVLVRNITLEDNTIYCWAVSTLTRGSKVVVDQTWARVAE